MAPEGQTASGPSKMGPVQSQQAKLKFLGDRNGCQHKKNFFRNSVQVYRDRNDTIPRAAGQQCTCVRVVSTRRSGWSVVGEHGSVSFTFGGHSTINGALIRHPLCTTGSSPDPLHAETTRDSQRGGYDPLPEQRTTQVPYPILPRLHGPFSEQRTSQTPYPVLPRLHGPLPEQRT